MERKIDILNESEYFLIFKNYFLNVYILSSKMVEEYHVILGAQARDL